tara:strand:+ start:32 stop:403 length:372 start_codon:yes stop_codon:yes gene_type:complete
MLSCQKPHFTDRVLLKVFFNTGSEVGHIVGAAGHIAARTSIAIDNMTSVGGLIHGPEIRTLMSKITSNRLVSDLNGDLLSGGPANHTFRVDCDPAELGAPGVEVVRTGYIDEGRRSSDVATPT